MRSFVLYLLFTFLYSFATLPILSKAFRVGESLKYKIRWGLMTVGYSNMSVVGKIHYKGKKCFVFKTEARGTKWVNTFFPVKDKIISFWDPVSQRPYYSEKDLNEGFYHRHHTVIYDHSKRIAFWKQKRISGNTNKRGVRRKNAKWKFKKGVTPGLPVKFQDMLSAIYYNRAHPAKGEPGKTFYLKVFDDLKLGTMKMSILRRETITLEVNGVEKTYKALVTKPSYKTSGIFRSKGKVLIWISDDEKRIPLKVTSKIPYMGHVTVEFIGGTF
ncbi:MAG: DUF3108 domain-containing protein [Spirochaetota bacterium]